jgi:NTE family protein
MNAGKPAPDGPVVAISLSGGGSRAMAFHLGCLRALKRVGLLEQAAVLSCVSGGSVIGAMYVTHDGDFATFEHSVRESLRRGFVVPTIKTALTSREGLRALFCALGLLSRKLFQVPMLPLYGLRRLAQVIFGVGRHERAQPEAPRRFASRTTVLRATFDRLLFEGRTLGEIKGRCPKFIATAAELRTGSAFYFSAEESGCWRFGKVNSDTIPIAEAVACSAAYPLFLPAVDRVFPFRKGDGSLRDERVTLTDGGVYDNLGLSPLWPDRDPVRSVAVPTPDVIIACRAGYGLRFGDPTVTLSGRMRASFFTTLDRAQNASLKRLFDLKAAGRLQAFLIPYLDQDDARLACAPPDLVKREEVASYPTDFSAMSDDWIERLSKRGEQVTLALLKEHSSNFAFTGIQG